MDFNIAAAAQALRRGENLVHHLEAAIARVQALEADISRAKTTVAPNPTGTTPRLAEEKPRRSKRASS